MTRQITVALPDPGLPSERHEDDQIVWYGQIGEFVIDNRDMNPHRATAVSAFQVDDQTAPCAPTR